MKGSFIMDKILAGIDGSSRGEKALQWAARVAERNNAHLSLISVVSPEVRRMAGSNDELIQVAVEGALGEACRYVEENHPSLSVSSSSVDGDIVEALVGASEENDMVVMGTHHTSSVSEKVWGAKGLRVSVSTSVPTAVVPSDWTEECEGRGIVVGVGPDDVSEAAVDLGVRFALSTNQPVKLVSAWGVPALLSGPAGIMGGGLAPVGRDFQRRLDAMVSRIREACPDLDVTGEAIEGPHPTQVLLECAKGASALVLGTHGRSMVGRAFFGSITYGALGDQSVPTIVVPSRPSRE